VKPPNIAVNSNLMPDEHQFRPEYRFVPGDLVAQIYRNLADVRVAESALSQNQLKELRQYLICLRCGRPCAGTCTQDNG